MDPKSETHLKLSVVKAEGKAWARDLPIYFALFLSQDLSYAITEARYGNESSRGNFGIAFVIAEAQKDPKERENFRHKGL